MCVTLLLRWLLLSAVRAFADLLLLFIAGNIEVLKRPEPRTEEVS